MVLRVVFVLCLIAAVIGECTYDSDRYVTYRGCANTDHNSEDCINWLKANKWGDEEFITRNEAHANGVGDHNYCRNPGGKRHGVWCYKASKTKVYCAGVNDKTCVTQPEDDTKCPEATNRRLVTVAPQPEIEHMNAMIGGTLDLQCKEGCSEDVLWESRPGLNEVGERSNRLTINPVTSETAGNWECRCGRRRYVKAVKTCTIAWSDCRQVGGKWVKEGTNSCTGTKTPHQCPPSEEVNSSEQDGEDHQGSTEQPNDIYTRGPKRTKSGDAQARKEGRGKEEESCTGSECSFCNKNSLICGALGCLGGALTVVAAVFVKKSLQWRRTAKESRPDNGGTMESQMTGSQAYSRQTADRNQLDYERALQIEDLVSQRRKPGLSCSTSVTDTMHLQHLRQHDQLGRIQSNELQSEDIIVCQRFEDSEVLIDHFAGAHQKEDVMIYQEESAPIESKGNTAGRPRFEDAGGQRDGTLFDKYYDQDVDKWSINEEVEI